MNKIEKLLNLKDILNIIIGDNTITLDEISLLQDWIDENAIYFVGERYNDLIIPLQRFIEDGCLTENELNDIRFIIDSEIA